LRTWRTHCGRASLGLFEFGLDAWPLSFVQNNGADLLQCNSMTGENIPDCVCCIAIRALSLLPGLRFSVHVFSQTAVKPIAIPLRWYSVKKKHTSEVHLMCRILSSQPASSFAYQTRSVRLGGHATSIKLEAAFWDILEEIAVELNKPLGRFLTELHDEVMYIAGDTHNFTSLLRCACLTYVSEIRGRQNALTLLNDKPRRLFDGPLEAAE